MEINVEQIFKQTTEEFRMEVEREGHTRYASVNFGAHLSSEYVKQIHRVLWNAYEQGGGKAVHERADLMAQEAQPRSYRPLFVGYWARLNANFVKNGMNELPVLSTTLSQASGIT